MNQEQLDDLARRANWAGYSTIPEHYAECLLALRWIANHQSGVWGVRAREALGWSRRPVDQASRAVAQRGHDQLDQALDERLGE